MNKDKNIVRLYLLVGLSIILNIVFVFTGHEFVKKNRDLKREVSVLCDNLQDLRYLVDTNHNNERGWREIEEAHNKMVGAEIANLEIHIEDLSKRVTELEAERAESTSDKDMAELKSELGHIKKSLFGLANQVSSNMNAVRNLEENLQIVDTRQWSAIRKLEKVFPRAGLFY